MSTDKTPEQVESAVQEMLRAEAARRDPVRVERAFNELMWRDHPVAKMIRKGREAKRWV